MCIAIYICVCVCIYMKQSKVLMPKSHSVLIGKNKQSITDQKISREFPI